MNERTAEAIGVGDGDVVSIAGRIQLPTAIVGTISRASPPRRVTRLMAPPSVLRPNRAEGPRITSMRSTSSSGIRSKFTSSTVGSLRRTPSRKTLKPWGSPVTGDAVNPRSVRLGWKRLPCSFCRVTHRSFDTPRLLTRSISTSANLWIVALAVSRRPPCHVMLIVVPVLCASRTVRTNDCMRSGSVNADGWKKIRENCGCNARISSSITPTLSSVTPMPLLSAA